VGCEDALSQLTDSKGRSVLVRAIESRKAKLCIELARRRIALAVINADGDTALHIAARTRDVDCIAALYLYISLDEENNKGETANDIIGESQETLSRVYGSLEGAALRHFRPDNYANALEIYRQIYRLHEKHFPPHTRTHIVIENMICCLIMLKRIDEALELMKKNLPWKVSYYEEYGPVMANKWTQFGDCFLAQEKYQEALEKFEKALQVWGEIENKNDIDMASVLNSIGLCYMGMEKYLEAIASIERGLVIMQQCLESTDPKIAQSLTLIENCRLKLRK